MPPFTKDDIPDLSGKVAIVTGGNRSLGLETSYMLLRKNAIVYIAGRSEQNYEEARQTLLARSDVTKDMVEHLHFCKLDLATMKPAYEAAKSFIETHDRLDIVVANAGISLQKSDELSKDGYELTFQTNQLGHFAFITPLLPLLEKTARDHGEARVVITSSDAHAFAKSGIDFEALNRTKPHRGLKSMGEALERYGVSKLANMLFARELDRRWAAPLRQQGISVIVDSVHPGVILNTGLGGKGEDWGLPRFVNTMVRSFGHVFGFSSLEGAMTQTYVATMPELQTKERHGLYYVPQMNWRGRYVSSHEQKPATRWGEDEELAAKLWSVCEDALKKVTNYQ